MKKAEMSGVIKSSKKWNSSFTIELFLHTTIWDLLIKHTHTKNEINDGLYNIPRNAIVI